MHLQPNTSLQGGKYNIHGLLGQGGFGITYLAQQVLLNRMVAIKEFFPRELCDREEGATRITLNTRNAAEAVERYKRKFLSEARTIAQFIHPRIVQIFDVFEENGTAYFVMEHIDGESIQQKIQREGRLDEVRAIRYIHDVCEALKVLHGRRVNHLDIKPSNIMVRRSDDRCVLIDFGVAKEYDVNGHELTTSLIGISAGYAPLEQYEKGGLSQFSPQTDIYALGATLFKMVTGSNPPSQSEIQGGFFDSTLQGLSPQVSEAIRRSMRPFREERPADIEAFHALLDAPAGTTLPPYQRLVGVNNSGIDPSQGFVHAQTLPIDSLQGQPTPPPSPVPPITPSPATPPPYMGSVQSPYNTNDVMGYYKRFQPTEKSNKQFNILLICIGIVMALGLLLLIASM